MSDKYLMYLNTVQGVSLKTLIEALKEVLTDVNVTIDHTGLEIVNINPTKIAIVHLKLDAAEFQEFMCPNKIHIGINLTAIHKLLKTIGNNDTVSLYVTKANPDCLGITILNKPKKRENNILYNLLDIDLYSIGIPDVEYDTHISMPCTDFQKYCREFATVSNFVEFLVHDKTFIIRVDGRFASQELKISETDDSETVINTKTPELQTIGLFSLKFLNLFCKSSTLCNKIELYLKADYPIVIVYSVASLGKCKYCLCSQTDIE